VTEKPEIADAGAEAVPGMDPAAIAMALGVASRDRADTFLEEQTRLVRLQAKELSHELELRHWSLWVRHLSGVLKLTFEIGLAVVGMGLACFITAAVWNAAHADGLVIESFSVPPDLAARGLTGQAVASKTLDDMIAMVNQAPSYRAEKSYANTLGDDIKVEIPETGVSVGEAYRFLKRWLGHETHISGEVIRTATGLAVTARVSGSSGITIEGGENDVDALVHKTAEYIYGSTQPYRYALYLTDSGRTDEAVRIYRSLIASGSAQERPWGYIGMQNVMGDPTNSERNAVLEQALSLQPHNVLFLQILSSTLSFQGRMEELYSVDQRTEAIFRRGGGGDLISESRLPAMQKAAEARMAMTTGDFRKAARDQADQITLGGLTRLQNLFSVKASAETGAHDLAAARTTMIDSESAKGTPGFPGSQAFIALTDIVTRMQMDIEAEDWAAARSRVQDVDLLIAKNPTLRGSLPTMAAPWIAFSQARLGHFAAAETAIAPTPATCYPCLRARARIAAMQRQNARADFWFARAAAAGPSLPFAHTEWGQALLERGDPDGAIAKFAIARQKGPRFADPLAYWGEALMAKNQSHLALAKFAAADQYAPNWGRLHLKWGEALFYAGKKDQARKQFTRAAALDLTPSEKTELARVNHV